jgi:predicted glycogen debranching enzyme
MMAFDQHTCRNLALARTLEWLHPNGIGGYASATIPGLNTRRYHGLLVAATEPPAGRMVLLSKIEEAVIVDGRRYDLATNRFPGVIYPAGYTLLTEFRLHPCPTFVFNLEGIEIEKRVLMVQGQNTVLVEYAFSGPACDLELRPLIAFRDYHATTHANSALNPKYQNDAGVITLQPYASLPPLYIAHDSAQVEPAGGWYYNFEYDIDIERGFEDREDLFNPFVARYRVNPGAVVSIIASTERHRLSEAPEMRRCPFIAGETMIDDLTGAANQFLAKRGELETIVAGYHWFCDWGRDTMISLLGLTLDTGRHSVAPKILLAFAQHVDQGMLPNRFPDKGETPEYNTVDAALWMFEAVRAYAERSGDWAFVKDNLYEVLTGIIEWHRRGTRFGIKMDTDGLLHAGVPGVQLTWMDAKVGDYVVTPRRGKPVEIQALWYNALRIMELLAARFGAAGQIDYGAMADLAYASFNRTFWNPQAGCLYDVIDGDIRDASLRPNQIFAVSLPNSMLEESRARAVVETVERELLTPRGLRTLATSDPQYCGRYMGDVMSRDTAYHQGTVWPWLMGPFFAAKSKLQSRDRHVAEVRAWLAGFEPHLSEAGVGQVSEIFDGDPPHAPRGCIAQAWSVAALLQLARSAQGETVLE